MLRRLATTLFTLLTLFFLPAQGERRAIKVLQFNIWQEGTVVAGGFEAVANEIARTEADFVTLSEVRNYHDTRFCDRIVEALQARGLTYYSFYSNDSGLLSRHPITDSCVVVPCEDDRGSIYRLVARIDGQEFAVYTAHLDYRNCAYYDVRGYNGSTWAKETPVTDVDSVLALNRASRRDDAIARFIMAGEEDKAAGRIVILGGDLNEPSFLDWTEETKDLCEHNGLVVPWDVSLMLSLADYHDVYREIYPNPVTHPGFTCPANNPDVELKRLVWSPEADDRERIDYIMYAPHEGFYLMQVTMVGPAGTIVRGARVEEQTADPLMMPLGTWPTDHRAVLATFEWYAPEQQP